MEIIIGLMFIWLVVLSITSKIQDNTSNDIKNDIPSDRHIIEVIGEAFKKAGVNGVVACYPYSKEICFWDMAKKKDLKTKEFRALLNHLGLEIVEGPELVVKKKIRKRGDKG